MTYLISVFSVYTKLETLSKISFNSYKLAVLSKLNSTFIADMNFPVEAYLNNEFARRFGRAEENIFIN